MTQTTKIQWTEKNWNPVRGCRRVSEGCRNCYAEKMAGRFCGADQPYDGIVERTKKGARWTGEGKFITEKLDEPLRLRKPSMIFVNSMSDLFFEEFTFSQIAAVFGVMAAASEHTFQVLTKRPERAVEFFAWLERHADDMAELYPDDSKDWRRGNMIRAAALNATHHKKLTEVVEQWPLPNVWIGVSAENQDTANERVPLLLELPAAVRFVSAEPLLGPIDLSPWMPPTLPTPIEEAPETWADWEWDGWVPDDVRAMIEKFWSDFGRKPKHYLRDCLHQRSAPYGMRGTVQTTLDRKLVTGRWIHRWNNMGSIVDDEGKSHCTSIPSNLFSPSAPRSSYQRIKWVIAGGESGPGARACSPEWIESIAKQCDAAGVACFVKQLGSVWSKQNSADDRKGGEPDEWPEELRVRQMPEVGQ